MDTDNMQPLDVSSEEREALLRTRLSYTVEDIAAFCEMIKQQDIPEDRLTVNIQYAERSTPEISLTLKQFRDLLAGEDTFQELHERGVLSPSQLTGGLLVAFLKAATCSLEDLPLYMETCSPVCRWRFRIGK